MKNYRIPFLFQKLIFNKKQNWIFKKVQYNASVICITFLFCMKLRKNNKAFTLIELLVVITILAVISVVAYTNFSGTTDKAKNSKKISDLASIETALQTFNQEKNYYPMPSTYSATNLWGYNWALLAQVNNTVVYTKPNSEIDAVTSWAWWWQVLTLWWVITTNQIWAKWTIDSGVLSKQYLSQDLLDPSVKDVKVQSTSNTLKDFWIWEYVYWVYAKGNTVWTSTSQKGSAYNLAVTISDEWKWFVTKLIWNFDKNTCSNCPDSLIWSWVTANANLKDWDSSTTWSWATEKVPYPIQF